MENKTLVIKSPNDKIIIKTSEDCSIAEVQEIYKFFEKFFPNNDIIMVPYDTVEDISIVRCYDTPKKKERLNGYFY